MPIVIKAVLLLGNPELIRESGKALWVVFDEVEKFYNHEKPRCVLERHVVGAEFWSDLADERNRSEFHQLSKRQLDELWSTASGRYRGTVDQAKLADLVGDTLGDELSNPQHLILVTDRELTPPSDWRYILWDLTGSGWVISIAPMDPQYWGISDPSRSEIIKHRLRAACMCVVGVSLGLKRCDNEQCYLFANVDSVSRLDMMVSLGTEHGEFAASDPIGYSTRSNADPAIEQEIASSGDLEIDGWAPLA